MWLPTLLVLAQGSAEQPAVKARETAYARIAVAQRIAANPELLKAIEAKWIRTFQEGKPVFVDEPSLDASTNVYAVQLPR